MMLLLVVSYSHHLRADFAEMEYDSDLVRNIKLISLLNIFF